MVFLYFILALSLSFQGGNVSTEIHSHKCGWSHVYVTGIHVIRQVGPAQMFPPLLLASAEIAV